MLIKDFDSKVDFPIIKILKERFPDTELVLCFPVYNPQLEKVLNEEQMPHYYNEFVTTWDRFHGFLSLNVTDIFVAEELAFSAKILSDNAKNVNKKLRVFCNICQSSWDKTESLKTFFIRPEDLHLYEGIFDTIEFYTDEKDVVKLNVLYEIYIKNRAWFGPLAEIIVGYNGKEDSRFIAPRFGEKRVNCEKKCVKGVDSTCHLCDRIQELEKVLKTAKIGIEIDKKEKF